MLTKAGYERARMIVCSPDSGPTGENAHWRSLLERLMVNRVTLHNKGINIFREDNKPLKKPEGTTELALIEKTINLVPWEDLDIAKKKEWGPDDMKNKVSTYQQVTKCTTLHPKDRAYEVKTPSTTFVDAENDSCTSELPRSIHPDSNVHDAIYVHTIIEDVELEVDEPQIATEDTLFSLSASVPCLMLHG